jgi:hypothetical protein
MQPPEESGEIVSDHVDENLAGFTLAVAFPCMDPAKLKLVPLDPDIPTNPEHMKDFRLAFGLK